MPIMYLGQNKRDILEIQYPSIQWSSDCSFNNRKRREPLDVFPFGRGEVYTHRISTTPLRTEHDDM